MKPAARIRGILFDKDGTLFDFHSTWAPVNLKAAALASGGDEPLRLRLLAIGGINPANGHAAADGLLASGNAAEIAEAWAVAGSPVRADRLRVALDQLFLEAAGNMVPATDLPALFRRLNGHGLRLGIASSDSAAAVREAAERFGMAPFLDFSCGYDSGFGHKPTEGMPLAFCRAVGLSPGEIAVVGDNAHDMEMGRRAGAGQRIGVLTGTGTRDTLAPFADGVIAGLDELEAFLGLNRI
jgi:phosphoglycolate phosphatase